MHSLAFLFISGAKPPPKLLQLLLLSLKSVWNTTTLSVCQCFRSSTTKTNARARAHRRARRRPNRHVPIRSYDSDSLKWFVPAAKQNKASGLIFPRWDSPVWRKPSRPRTWTARGRRGRPGSIIIPSPSLSGCECCKWVVERDKSGLLLTSALLCAVILTWREIDGSMGNSRDIKLQSVSRSSSE